MRAILADKSGEFAVRAITRKPDSDKAHAAREARRRGGRGRPRRHASLRKAFTGAYGAFCVTNFWEHFSPEKEMAQAQRWRKRRRSAGVKHAHLVAPSKTRASGSRSSDDRMPTLKGKYKVPHFDAKGEIDHFFTDAGVPTTFLYTSFYWDNLHLLRYGAEEGRRRQARASRCRWATRSCPASPPRTSASARTASSRAARSCIGKTVGIAGEHLTRTEMAAALGRALGSRSATTACRPTCIRSFGFPGADDLGNMFQYKRRLRASTAPRAI